MSRDSTPRFDDRSASQQRFLLLFLRSGREIFPYVPPLLTSVTNANDTLQQTALVLWKKFDAHNPAQLLTPWVCRYASNKSRQWTELTQRWQALRERGVLEELAQRGDQLRPNLVVRLKHLGKLPEQVASSSSVYSNSRPRARTANGNPVISVTS